MLLIRLVRVAVEIGEQEVEEHSVRQNENERPFRIVAVVEQQLTTVQECQAELALFNVKIDCYVISDTHERIRALSRVIGSTRRK